MIQPQKIHSMLEIGEIFTKFKVQTFICGIHVFRIEFTSKLDPTLGGKNISLHFS